ncbi:MAG: tetratricopeptide repeat protein [Bradymonadales bacterium]|jgi:tetratricopeptide (TPR) repeat protein
MFKRFALSISVVFFVLCVFATAVFAQSSGQDFFERGNKLYNAQKYSEAVSSYQKAIQLSPRSQTMAYLNCARAYNMLKDYVLAQRYYDFYITLVPSAENDRKIKGELKAVSSKAQRLPPYSTPESQRTVLDQLNASLKSGGPILTAQNGGALAYYDVLLRTGFAEPELIQFQRKLAVGLYNEIVIEISPTQSQPLPALDRMGWERVRNKIQRLLQFSDVEKDLAQIQRLEKTAIGWETYYKGDYMHAEASFREACSGSEPVLAACWGRAVAAAQTQDSEGVLLYIDEAEKAYEKAKHLGVKPYLNVLRAKVYSVVGKHEESLRLLETI